MAARPIATAVFIPIGSISTFLRAAAGTCLRTAAACFALVTVQMRSGEISGFRRATVCCNMVSLPTIFRSCFGVRVRLRGQKRVPRPPARITAWVASAFSFFTPHQSQYPKSPGLRIPGYATAAAARGCLEQLLARPSLLHPVGAVLSADLPAETTLRPRGRERHGLHRGMPRYLPELQKPETLRDRFRWGWCGCNPSVQWQNTRTRQADTSLLRENAKPAVRFCRRFPRRNSLLRALSRCATRAACRKSPYGHNHKRDR